MQDFDKHHKNNLFISADCRLKSSGLPDTPVPAPPTLFLLTGISSSTKITSARGKMSLKNLGFKSNVLNFTRFVAMK